MPAIVHMGPKGAGHYEAVGEAEENGVLILDLNSWRWQSAAGFRAHWSGYVLQLKKESAEGRFGFPPGDGEHVGEKSQVPSPLEAKRSLPPVHELAPLTASAASPLRIGPSTVE